MSAFMLTEQKEHLAKLGETLAHIESCNTLAEIDPSYYGNKKQEYVMQYAMQMSQMAQSVFQKGVQAPNAILIGEIKHGLTG